MTSLAALRILVTRPQPQAGALAAAIESQGGNALIVPMLETVALPLTAAMKHTLETIANYHVVTFISRNAVNYTHALMPLNALALPTVLAPGVGTAETLAQCGLSGIIKPQTGHTSEALLAETVLKKVKDQRILIVRGKNGRETLRETLVARGAIVDYLEVYQRQRPADAKTQMATVMHYGLDAICANSAETVDNLVDSTSCRQREALLTTPLFIPSDRVAAIATAHGFHRVFTTVAPENTGIVNSLINWAKSPSING